MNKWQTNFLGISIRSSLLKKNYTIYIHTFNVGSIRFNGATDNPIEMMDAFNSAKGEVNIFMTFDEFTNQKAASGSNEVIRDINNDDAAKMFQMGKPVMFIGIADQLLFPLKNLFSGQSENDQSNWKVIDLAILQTSETVLHECLAHCEKRLLGNNIEDPMQDHEDYHGEHSQFSPPAAEILINQTKYKGTRAYKVAREVYLEMKKENRIINGIE